MSFFLVSLSKCSGCEFFRDFKDNEYIADGLHFNWQQVNFTDVIGIRSHVLTFCQSNLRLRLSFITHCYSLKIFLRF